MSSSSLIKIFYGNGEIIYGPTGVDLSQFNNVTVEHPNPEMASIRDLKDWFVSFFQMDGSVYSVTIQCLYVRLGNPINYELRDADRSYKWKKWVQWCRRCRVPLQILVQACLKEGVGEASSSQISVSESICQADEALHEMVIGDGGRAETEAEGGNEGGAGAGSESVDGVADGGERATEILEELEIVDQNAMEEDANLNDEDDDDEEMEDTNRPIPEEWNRPDASRMEVVDLHQSGYQYGCSMIEVNQLFPNKQELKDTVARWAVVSLREVWVKTSSPSKYSVKCRDPECNFYVNAYKPKYELYWIASIVRNHTCTLQNLGNRHRNLTANLIANELYSEIIEKRDMECSFIQRAIRRQFKYDITYQKAWRAKQIALEKRWGSYEASYSNLPRVLDVLKERNPGTYTAFKESINEDGSRVFRRAFLSLGPCIESFKFCRPVLCVDGTFLTGKYKGQILTAIGVDANQQILPLAFAFVEGENKESWLWFLRHLKAGVVSERQNLCIIHDRHAGLISAIKSLQEDPNEPFPWPDLQSRWCMRHMGANFYTKFKSKKLMDMFKKLCCQNQVGKFNALWEELDKLTSAHVLEMSKKPLTEDNNPSTPGLPPLGDGLDEPGVRRRRGRNIKCFSHWIEAEPKEKWALLYDTYGARWGIMTSNLAEVYNWVIRGLRGLPLVAIVEGMLNGVVQYYRKRRLAAVAHCATVQTPYCKKMYENLEKSVGKAAHHIVVPFGNVDNRFQVTCRAKGGLGRETTMITHNVNLGRQFNGWAECECNKPTLLHVPCSHVIASLSKIGASTNSYISTFYLKENVVQTWTGEFYGFLSYGDFTIYNKDLPICLPPMELLRHSHGKGGRPQTRRIRNDMDESEVGGAMRRCRRCEQFGHKSNACPASNEASSSTPINDDRGRGRRGRGRRGGRTFHEEPDYAV
ncbi:unnamed protein product [Urochloa humidicola]